MKMLEPDIAKLVKVTEPASKIMHPDVDTLAQTAAK
jgi:hypothetical protein